MKKNTFVIGLLISLIFLGIGIWILFKGIFLFKTFLVSKEQNKTIENIINTRKTEALKENSDLDPFGQDNIVKILLIGLDKRAGQESGHCDAIQLITIDKNKKNILITAVPRGTYSPLPPGKGTTSTDYYVSNACGLGGLEYGIKQIENILGQKADYLAVVGFSETIGILRNLKLPTTETLQWLRQRHVFAIGEPQRARDHSTFLKYLLTNHLPTKNSQTDKALEYIIYKIVKTDLSFAQTQTIIKTLSDMDLVNHPELIQLAMRPAYDVQDIEYTPENLSEYLEKMLAPIKNQLSKDDYSEITNEEAQARILKIFNEKKEDPNFITWAFDNNFWLQIEDVEKRLFIQFDFLKRYLQQIPEKQERQNIILDYILEMENRGETEWLEKGKNLLITDIYQVDNETKL